MCSDLILIISSKSGANNSQYFDDQYNNLAVAELQIKSDSDPLSSHQ